LRSIIARSVPGLTDLGAGRDEHSTAEFVQCFSEDPNMLAFARLFCSRMHDDGLGFAPNGASHSSVSDEHVPFCTNVLHECLAHDKPEILATYLSIYFHLRQLDAKPDVQVSAPVHSATDGLFCGPVHRDRSAIVERPSRTVVGFIPIIHAESDDLACLQAIAGIKFILAFYSSPLPQKVLDSSQCQRCSAQHESPLRVLHYGCSLAVILRARHP
jgi:hypothetical protein